MTKVYKINQGTEITISSTKAAMSHQTMLDNNLFVELNKFEGFEGNDMVFKTVEEDDTIYFYIDENDVELVKAPVEMPIKGDPMSDGYSGILENDINDN